MSRWPNATAQEKVDAAVMGGVMGFLMPGLALGQVLGGSQYFLAAVEGGLTDEAALRELAKGQVIGGILGGAAQAFVGALAAGGLAGGNVAAGAAAAVESVLWDALGAYLGYQLADAMGVDPWEGATVGMTMTAAGRGGLHSLKMMGPGREGPGLRQAAKNLKESLGRGEVGRQLSADSQLRTMAAKESRASMEAAVNEKRSNAGGRTTTDGKPSADGAALGKEPTADRGREGGRPDRDPGDPLKLEAARDESCGVFKVDRAENGSVRRTESCFATGTPLQTPGGSKLVEDFVPGDLVLSRDQSRPDGPVEAKVVEAVFRRAAPILHLHVGGRVIRTTAEHPFYAFYEGWVRAGDLKAGDWLLGIDGGWTAVEETFDTGEWEDVYNIRVADTHTYFVGGDEWGFSVWAHNAYAGDAAGKQAEVTAMLEEIGYSPKTAARMAKRYARDGFNGDGLHANLKAYIDAGGEAYTYPGEYTRTKEAALTGAKPRLPKDGVWTGEPGHSRFIPDNPAALGLQPGEAIPFRNGRPLFTEWRVGPRRTSVEPLTGVGNADREIFIRSLQAEFNANGKSPHGGGWTQDHIEAWMRTTESGLRPHHSGGDTFEMIPIALHDGIRHTGAAADRRFGGS